jgi:hypothetical protein
MTASPDTWTAAMDVEEAAPRHNGEDSGRSEDRRSVPHRGRSGRGLVGRIVSRDRTRLSMAGTGHARYVNTTTGPGSGQLTIPQFTSRSCPQLDRKCQDTDSPHTPSNWDNRALSARTLRPGTRKKGAETSAPFTYPPGTSPGRAHTQLTVSTSVGRDSTIVNL